MLSTIPMFHLISFYISGILLATYYPSALSTTLILLLALSLIYCVAAIFTISWRNTIGLFLILLMGYSNLLLQNPPEIESWIQTPIKAYTVAIAKVYDPFICKGLITHIKDQVGWHNSDGSIQLYFPKIGSYKPKKGDRLLIYGTPLGRLPSERIASLDQDRAPHRACMYKHFLKQIEKDFTLLPRELFHQKGNWIITQWCSQQLQRQLQDQQAIALISALLWGAREQLDLALQKSYADTGTIHVLAISGLHVGMVYLVVNTVFKYISRQIGCLLLSDLFTLLILWLYAWLCHFQPPIMRATIMITMGRIGYVMGRGSNPYNGLLVSAFALLLWSPSALFNCAFQLSYLATLGILYIHPPIHGLITPQNYWLQKIWTATTLSIAAQFTTLPLILYYFKQFPLYFIIANWLVVPAMFAILMLSLLFLVASQLPLLGTLLGFILEKLIDATNAWVSWVATWPMSTLGPYYINKYAACVLYVLLFAIWLFFEYKNLIYLMITSLCITWHSLYRIEKIITRQQQCKLICYNNHRLSFMLKDGIERLSCDELLGKNSILQPYAGGIIATWYNKVICTLETIPPDWYGWHGDKLSVDYLLIDAYLLHDIT